MVCGAIGMLQVRAWLVGVLWGGGNGDGSGDGGGGDATGGGDSTLPVADTVIAIFWFAPQWPWIAQIK